MHTTNNAGIITAAMRGINATNGRGSFTTDAYQAGFTGYGAPYVGHLPRKLTEILDERFRQGAVAQVIYSYSTPIAWLDAGAWIIPNVRYSATTSSKHQSQLHRLPGAIRIPRDEGMNGYMGLLNGTKRPYTWEELQKYS